jgi:uncharacterized protein
MGARPEHLSLAWRQSRDRGGETVTKALRRQPQRTCIACRSISTKRALVRVVRRPDGGVEIDPRGKVPGRGAYLCASRACWELALGQKRIARALNMTLTEEQLAMLQAYAAGLPVEAEAEAEKSAQGGELKVGSDHADE